MLRSLTNARTLGEREAPSLVTVVITAATMLGKGGGGLLVAVAEIIGRVIFIWKVFSFVGQPPSATPFHVEWRFLLQHRRSSRHNVSNFEFMPSFK